MIKRYFDNGRFSIALFDVWLGFSYKNLKCLGRRIDFGFLKIVVWEQ